MAQYNALNVKLSNSQLNKLRSGIQNGTEVTLNHQNNSSIHIKLSKTHLFYKVQLGGFLGRLLEPLLKIGLSLMKNLLKPLV